MSLPTVNGIGFLLSDGVELKFGTSGTAWARLPLSFKNRRRDADGNWSHDKEIVIEAMVFGDLAEYLADHVEGRQDLAVTGELYTEPWRAKDGTEKSSVKMRVLAASPVGSGRREKVAVAAAAADDAPPF